jgi:WbqC-like protein family
MAFLAGFVGTASAATNEEPHPALPEAGEGKCGTDMVVTIHQPAYLPWLGYLDRVARSDVFIFLDTVQFERNSFTNRNRIKTANGPIWLTVPVRLCDHLNSTIADVEIGENRDWRRKHLASIAQSYRRAPGFASRYERLAAAYANDTRHLAEFCFDQLGFWLAEFHIATSVVRASELAVEGRNSALVLALCKHAGAHTYLSGPLGRDYLQEDEFAAAGIEVRYHDYAHPHYPQLHGDFVPAMGIVDYWMNCPDAGLPGGAG